MSCALITIQFIMKTKLLPSVCFLAISLTVAGCGQSELELTKELAEQGDAVAQLKLGRLYAEGDFVKKDDSEAAMWYLSAAEQGQADAQVWLGMAYQTGQGVPKDYVEAYAWFDVAAASIKNSELRRDGVRVLLSPEQLEMGQRRATELANREVSGK